MHFLKRTLSFTRFQVIGDAAFAQDKYQEALNKFRFQELANYEDEDESVGWVSPENCLQPPQLGTMLVDPYFRFTMRVDKRKVPKTLFDAYVAIEEKAELEASGKKKISINKKRDIKQSVKSDLLAKTPPNTAIFKALWNLSTNYCYLFSTSKSAINHFCKLFTETFKLELEPCTPFALANNWASEHNVLDILKNLEPYSTSKDH